MLDPLPVRIYAARRAATSARLTGSGIPEADAERWLAAWETEAAAAGESRDDRDLWTSGVEWIAAQPRR